MIDKEKAKLNMKKQWLKFGIVIVLYALFIVWVAPRSIVGWLLTLVGALFFFDVYITKKVNWQWWKNSEKPVRVTMSWVDAIIFALVAVYFINQFLFQNYVIPSSSLEKSLLTGDYLAVSKVSYGPRIPQTPLSMPLTQHTLPLFGCKSYIEWPHWDYRRMKGLGNVQLNDIVVFNFPAGDTIMTDQKHQADDYYRTVYILGLSALNTDGDLPYLPSLSPLEQRAVFDKAYAIGRSYIAGNAGEYGDIGHRPTDRRENYVKRCVGLPGQTLQIKDRIVYLDGKANKEPDNVQYSYYVKLRQNLPDELMRELNISMEDLTTLNQFGFMPLTKRAVNALRKRTDLVQSIQLDTDPPQGDLLYPLNAWTGWTRDNYGPIWIPKKGETLKLTLANLPMYERCIKVYENNDLEVKDGKIYINGKPATSYTFKMDYYWMMGDNRHNSADSRYWGFVPEDHVVGKPIFIWWSSDPDRHGFKGIRWSRLFRMVDNIK